MSLSCTGDARRTAHPSATSPDLSGHSDGARWPLETGIDATHERQLRVQIHRGIVCANPQTSKDHQETIGPHKPATTLGQSGRDFALPYQYTKGTYTADAAIGGAEGAHADAARAAGTAGAADEERHLVDAHPHPDKPQGTTGSQQTSQE